MLVDALRPPDGHVLHTAVGTSFTLDLNALLLASVSFAVFDRLDTEDGRPDPIALLESIRRHADNITVFAQAGALAGPRNHPPILAYLEDTVVPVLTPRPGHLFHPKVWALKFVDEDGAATYRLIVLSRNLTFDSSWDTIVTLDGAQSDRPHRDGPQLASFIESLPELSVKAMDPLRVQRVTTLAGELESVRWDNPDGVRRLRLHPMGLGGASPTIGGDRTLVISPFLSPATDDELSGSSGRSICISRPPALDGVGAASLSGYEETAVIDATDESADDVADRVDSSDRDSDTEADAQTSDIDPPRPGSELSGLHAKVFVAESENQVRLWLGSANATEPAFNGNVEFLVEGLLDPNQYGIDQILDSGQPTLRSMLVSYRPSGDEPAEPTEVEALTRDLDRLVRELSTGRFSIDVSPGEEGRWTLDLAWPPLTQAQIDRIESRRISLAVSPATRRSHGVEWADGGAIVPNATLEAITGFLVIEASASVDGERVVARSLVNAELSGGPADRKEQLLASVLDDPEKVLRYLLFLLAELTGDSSLLDAMGAKGGSFSWGDSADGQPPVLESLLRALADAPESLGRVAEFIADLDAGSGASLLPDDFTQVWQAINQVREAEA